ncbi:hypothetical protein ACFYW8_34580 [Streptomyces sp. NPDC002742]|uniref:hypothetical protein n=1 Tax=Streptomyces sp. NPDC002742 TaxID=3364663 RepID=UPI003685FF69
MVSRTARIGGLLGAAATFGTAIVGVGVPSWMVAGLAAGALVLLVLVLFLPNETPARRLGQLIQAWRNPVGATAGSSPAPSAGAPSPAARNGSA